LEGSNTETVALSIPTDIYKSCSPNSKKLESSTIEHTFPFESSNSLQNVIASIPSEKTKSGVKLTGIENISLQGKAHVTLKGQPLVQRSLPQVFHNEKDVNNDDPIEPNVQNRGGSNSELSDLESEDSSSIIIESDSEYSPGVVVESDSDYSLDESSNTENAVDEDDEEDFVLAQNYLQNEVQIKRRLQRKFLWYSRMLNK
jgi:hypothetical protein